MQVEEFCKCVYVRHLKSLAEGLLIIWSWSDSKDDDTAHSDEEKSLSCNSSSTEADVSEDEWVQSKTSAVNFKCVGVTRDALYQENLKKAFLARKEGRSVGVRLMPQPDNPYDSHAVAFECQVDDSGGVFGYVIRELCDHVLNAISNEEIISVDFAWIKYKILKTTGAGYYASVKVTKKKQWAQIFHTQSDTMLH